MRSDSSWMDAGPGWSAQIVTNIARSEQKKEKKKSETCSTVGLSHLLGEWNRKITTGSSMLRALLK
eukprot:6479003-Amphidinium_carterae.1